ncbi:ABC transporter permease [Halopelagius longus]|uniref:ABC transporter permease n=1 Tax=Halopelagius longus TaxID=1236180 RepID=A0A1H0Y0F7_9EURY|nr:ABC transporter permease [Halopelagius longus]RDI72207.1 ABC transporter permease [Halopelagius longus]SDQ08634.1 peptide/nickel transport system permease protein [Halopelagius longus]
MSDQPTTRTDVDAGADAGADAPAGEDEEQPEARVGWRYTLSQVKRDPTALAGLCIIAVMAVIAAIAFVDGVLFEYLADYQVFANMGVHQYVLAETFWVNPAVDPGNAQILRPPVGLTNQLYPEQPGTWAHPLGTDHRGRDILVRLFYGTRIAITVGIVSTGLALVLGTLVGAVAGYYGGWIDDALMRTAETLYAIPFLVLVIAFMTAFGVNLIYAMVGVGIATIPTFARLIRSRVLSVREEDYVEAARAAGVRDRNIILRHVIPNSFAPVLVQATLQIGVNILIIAGLSFLGYGAQPPTPSWGQMLSNSRQYMLPNPWFSIWPGIAILVTVIGFNLIGDGLRDALDPRINN